MRRILVDEARCETVGKAGRRPLARAARGRGGCRNRPTSCWHCMRHWTELAAEDPLKAQLVELRYFAGLTGDQAADVLGISPSDRRSALGVCPRLGCKPKFAAAARVKNNSRNLLVLAGHKSRLSYAKASSCLERIAHERGTDFSPGAGAWPRIGVRPTSTRPAARMPPCDSVWTSCCRAHANPGSFLAVARSSVGVDHASTNCLLNSPGTQIGPYKLLQQIGEGGMGVVYMAEQTEPVRRRVALKIIKPGMDTRQVIARFEAERQALALMDHPNIAKVLDAGTAAPDESPYAGRPYFVMELVKGVPITQYCDEHHLTPRQRLELFVPVCQAIQHAHQKGIIHRDIKPTNVLVAEYDEQAGAQGDRLRRGQGDRPAADRKDDVHRVRPDRRHAGVHEPRAGQAQPARHRHAERHLLAGRAAVRTADRHDAVRSQAAAGHLARSKCCGSSARRNRRRRAPA